METLPIFKVLISVAYAMHRQGQDMNFYDAFDEHVEINIRWRSMNEFPLGGYRVLVDWTPHYSASTTVVHI